MPSRTKYLAGCLCPACRHTATRGVSSVAIQRSALTFAVASGDPSRACLALRLNSPLEFMRRRAASCLGFADHGHRERDGGAAHCLPQRSVANAGTRAPGAPGIANSSTHRWASCGRSDCPSAPLSTFGGLRGRHGGFPTNLRSKCSRRRLFIPTKVSACSYTPTRDDPPGFDGTAACFEVRWISLLVDDLVRYATVIVHVPVRPLGRQQ